MPLSKRYPFYYTQFRFFMSGPSQLTYESYSFHLVACSFQMFGLMRPQVKILCWSHVRRRTQSGPITDRLVLEDRERYRLYC